MDPLHPPCSVRSHERNASSGGTPLYDVCHTAPSRSGCGYAILESESGWGEQLTGKANREQKIVPLRGAAPLHSMCEVSILLTHSTLRRNLFFCTGRPPRISMKEPVHQPARPPSVPLPCPLCPLLCLSTARGRAFSGRPSACNYCLRSTEYYRCFYMSRLLPFLWRRPFVGNSS